MGFGFLAPLLLGGVALLAIPYLVHRMRRTEPRTLRFSSLLFVPPSAPRAIERRRVEHRLLMLLRMLLLLLLTTAFARPFQEALSAPSASAGRAGRHLIALDISSSMAAPRHMEEARERALALVDSLSAEDRVAVLYFARRTFLAAPFLPPGAAAREAIARAAWSWEATDYAAALQQAERLLLEQAGEDAALRVHLVSDFRESGMPPPSSGWRLSARVGLDPVPVDLPFPPNRSVQELAVRPLGRDRVQIRARLKYGSGERDLPIEARLVSAGQVLDRQTRTVSPGDAALAVFTLPWDGRTLLQGHVEIDADALPADDRRYFAWSPARPRRVLLVRDPESRWPYERLLQAAVPEGADLPWQLHSIPPGELAARLSASPDLVVAADPGALDIAALRAYVLEGGRLFLPLGARALAGPVEELLGGEALRLEGPRFARTGPSRFAQLAWVDLDHPVFQPFRGPRFNDFSALRFYNYHRLRPGARTAVLARFREESGESLPAIVEVICGRGRALLWSGGLDLDWSTLPRSPRFVPLLHETLRYLAPEPPPAPAREVGDPLPVPVPPWEVALDAAENAPAADLRHLEAPGWLRWRHPDQERVEAVNTAARESDPARLSAAEFSIRLCAAPAAEDPPLPSGPRQRPEPREYGRAFLVLLLVFLGIESLCAARLVREKRP